jgi:hypothetical protein
MNGWLRLEAEQRGKWQQVRVQDLRAAQVAKQAAAALPAPARLRPTKDRRSAAGQGCPEAA